MRFLIEWKDTGEQAVKDFGILPDDMTDSEKMERDEEIFYWLTPDEAINAGADYDGGDWFIIQCACDECEEYENGGEI